MIFFNYNHIIPKILNNIVISNENNRKYLLTKREGGCNHLPSICFEGIDNKDSGSGMLQSIRENENDDKLFWYSYDEDLEKFPMALKLEKIKFVSEDILTKQQNILKDFKKPISRFKRKISDISERNHVKEEKESDDFLESSEEKTNTVNSMNHY